MMNVTPWRLGQRFSHNCTYKGSRPATIQSGKCFYLAPQYLFIGHLKIKYFGTNNILLEEGTNMDYLRLKAWFLVLNLIKSVGNFQITFASYEYRSSES